MTTIYRTQEQMGYGRQESYWNEYRLEGGTVVKYRCRRAKFFDGKENNWESEENAQETWALDDPSLPEWLKQYL